LFALLIVSGTAAAYVCLPPAGARAANVAAPQQGTATPTFPAATATPALCPGNYVYTTTTAATIVPGTTDTGNHCDDCLTTISLPFAYTLYDQSFSSALVSSNGPLIFGTGSPAFFNTCLPVTGCTYTIFP